MSCHLVLTTGGTGPARRDVTPDATLAVADREMPGFGEQMRQISLHFVPTAILSRQVGVIRKQALILNLPGQPKSIKETLEGVKDAAGNVVVHGIFASVPYCIQLLEGHTLKRHQKWLLHSDRRVQDATLANKKSPSGDLKTISGIHQSAERCDQTARSVLHPSPDRLRWHRRSDQSSRQSG